MDHFFQLFNFILQSTKEINHDLGANIVMAGVIIRESDYFTEKEGLDGILDMFEKKVRANMLRSILRHLI